MYFLGIGGIGMSSLARYFKLSGREIAGYDRTATGLTNSLVREGMPVHYTDKPEYIPSAYHRKESTLVVYTPAIPSTHSELNYFRKEGFRVVKRAELLGMVSKGHLSVAIAGTHGKTSVSTLLAHILVSTPAGCIAFLGGISKNHNSNLIMAGKHSVMVMEADEFDRSFLQLHPLHALVTSIDPDHLDVYGEHRHLREAFGQFISQIGSKGSLLVKKGLDVKSYLPGQVRMAEYDAEGKADFYASSIQLYKGRQEFDLVTPEGTIRALSLGLPGKASLQNAVGAAAMAWLLGTDGETIRGAMASFLGVVRRFDVQVETPAMIYMDDYAHHPEELNSCINAVRETYPGKHLTGVFQPHLYSRTRDLAEGFARSLDMLDRCILLDIYPAREEPLPGITSDTIREKMKNKNSVIRCTKEKLISCLEKLPLEVLLTLGAGDIDTKVQPIKEWILKERTGKAHA